MKSINETACHINDEGGMTDTVKLDFDSIPDFIMKDLAIAALEGYLRFVKRPDVQEILTAERELLRREGSQLLAYHSPDGL